MTADPRRTASEQGPLSRRAAEHLWMPFTRYSPYFDGTAEVPVIVRGEGAYVWDEQGNSHVAGLNLEWLIDNHWSVKGGLHTIWGGNENFRHDSGPFSTFVVPFSATGVGDNYAQQSVFGAAHEGIGALRANDELFFQLKYQF